MRLKSICQAVSIFDNYANKSTYKCYKGIFMKRWTRLLLVAILFCAVNAHAFYGWFPANARVVVTPVQAQAVFVNNLAYPVICRGQVFASTYNGLVANSWVNDVVVYPGITAYAYVYTNPYNPFVNAWSQIYCRVF